MRPDVFWTLWWLAGLHYAFFMAKGKQLASIKNGYQRRIAMVLCFPFFVSLWLVVRTIEYLFYVARDIPETAKTCVDSWNGIPKDLEAAP